MTVQALRRGRPEVLAEYQKYGFVARVEKPYRMQELDKTLRTVLEEGGF